MRTDPSSTLHDVLQVGDWEHASRLLNALQAAGLDPLAHEPLAAALCALVATALQPSFAALYPAGMRGPSILSRKVRACPRPSRC